MKRVPPAPSRSRLALLALGAASCAAPTHGAPAATTRGASSVARYAVHVSDGGSKLEVALDLAPGSPTQFVLEDGGERFAKDVSVTTPSGAPLASRWKGAMLDAGACELGCSIHYTFDLRNAASSLDDATTAARRAGAFLAPPSTWLLHPREPPVATRFEIAVQSPEEIGFASGIRASGKTFVGTWEDLAEPPYTAIGPMRKIQVPIGGRSVDVAIIGPHPDIGDEGIAHWIGEAGQNLSGFFGEYPRDGALVIVVVEPGSGVWHGSAMGNGGASILVEIGQATPNAPFANDWILTHEMFHLTFPGLARDHHWAEEGMATYLEPIARARRGIVPLSGVWREWFTAMAQGEPADGDHGLDETRTWGRTYWGGALFWMTADVEIRKRTENRSGLPDVFKAIYAQGNIAVRWPMSRIVTVADEATGTDVVSKLYATHAHAGVHIDIDKTFADLGVSMVHGDIVFDDTAPLASVRKAMVRGPGD